MAPELAADVADVLTHPADANGGSPTATTRRHATTAAQVGGRAGASSG
jgi:hypothetical protein